MSATALTIKALGERIARPSRGLRNRIIASRSRLGAPPARAETLPEPVLFGDAGRGQAMVGGTWSALGHDVALGAGTIWQADLADPRLEAERQSCLWLDDLAALGNRAARELAQAWVQDWIARQGRGRGPGWRPELTGRRVKRGTAHCILLTRGLDPAAEARFWRALAAQQRYLERTWPEAEPGLTQLRALAGLVWSGVALPHAGHRTAVGAIAGAAEAFIRADGTIESRAPEELAEALILLIWTARVLENAGQHAQPAHLAAIVRGVPVLRPLRLGDGSLGRFHGGGPGSTDRVDQALAELRIGVQVKPRLAMGYCRLTGGRAAVLIDVAEPPPVPVRAHAGTLAFEMSTGRHPLVVNAGPGRVFGDDWAMLSRQTAAHSTLEVDGRSAARFETRGLAARTFGARLADGPSLVSVRQAQDATGQWLLATHDGYIASHGLLHERRMFLDARGTELRGEDILTVPDARARAQCDRASDDGYLGFAVRFHLHPDVVPELDPVRALVLVDLPGGERWMLRVSGGRLAVEPSIYFDPGDARPRPTRQVVVHAGLLEYAGQVIWSIGRIAGAPAAPPAP